MTEAQPLISVVIPAYNREGTIARAIDSVLCQTYFHLELIVIDDGSTDQTAQIVAAYEDPRVRLVTLTSNGGASVARNRGIEEAAGDFVAFQDSDDAWLPSKLEAQVKFANEHPESDFFFCTLVRVVGSTRTAYQTPDLDLNVGSADIQRKLLYRNFAWTQTWFVRACVFNENIRFDTQVIRVQDWDLILEASKRFKLKHLDEVLVIAYETAGSLLTLTQQHARDLEVLLENHRELYQRYPDAYGVQARAIAYRAAMAGDNFGLRRWAWRAWRVRPQALKGWLTLVAAMFGSAIVKRVVNAVK